MLDDLDRRLLRHLQTDPDMAMSSLAERAATTSTVAARRVQRMKDAGIIKGSETIIDWSALGYAVEVSLRVTLDKTETRAFDVFIEAARKVNEIIEVQTFLGRVDLRLSVIARDMPHYQHIYRTHILTLPHISDIEALMHIARIKTDEELPV